MADSNAADRVVHLLDYGAGNVMSVRNAIRRLGFTIRDITVAEDFRKARRVIFPGVGNFGGVMDVLRKRGLAAPLKQYVEQGRPFMAICVGMQVLFDESEESPGVPGLGIIPGKLRRFRGGEGVSVPQIGWNTLQFRKGSHVLDGYAGERVYFVHSYCVLEDAAVAPWTLSTTLYGQPFVSSVQRGNVFACQFHPEKSGLAGLRMYEKFLGAGDSLESVALPASVPASVPPLSKRIIACLDVRPDETGQLVTTKGESYDVKEKGKVRNLGVPAEMARRYYEEGADEVTFLNITSFKNSPLADNQMLGVLRQTSENVFVPLTIGGGIRDYTDLNGRAYTALEVASEYFRSGADKVSIGSDAVLAAEAYWREKEGKSGARPVSSIEQIAQLYGRQAVVISVDPRRVYVASPDDSSATKHRVIETKRPGPHGEKYCWFQCTVRGGREGRDLDVPALVTACEQLGAGEILLNSLDMDGQNRGYDIELVRLVKSVVSIPVIASSGAGTEAHFLEVFAETNVEAALAAGIFHRNEITVGGVKRFLAAQGVVCRMEALVTSPAPPEQ